MRFAPLFLLAALISVMAIKYIAAMTSLAWVVRHGAEYRVRLHAHAGSAMSPAQYWTMLEETAGATFPFGVRQYRLNRYWRVNRDSRRLFLWCRAVSARAVELAFNIAALAITCSAVLVWLSGVPPAEQAFYSVVRVLGLVLAIMMVAYPMTIAAELVCSYARIGSYAGAFFRPHGYVIDARGGQLIREMQIFGFLLVTGYVLSGAALLYAGSHGACFSEVQVNQGLGYSLTKNVGESFYAALYNMLAEDDAGPRNGVGKFLTALIAIQGCSVIVVGFGALATLPTLIPHADPGVPVQRNSKSDAAPISDIAAVVTHGNVNRTASTPRTAMIVAVAAVATYILMKRLGRKRR